MSDELPLAVKSLSLSTFLPSVLELDCHTVALATLWRLIWRLLGRRGAAAAEFLHLPRNYVMTWHAKAPSVHRRCYSCGRFRWHGKGGSGTFLSQGVRVPSTKPGAGRAWGSQRRDAKHQLHCWSSGSVSIDHSWCLDPKESRLQEKVICAMLR